MKPGASISTRHYIS